MVENFQRVIIKQSTIHVKITLAKLAAIEAQRFKVERNGHRKAHRICHGCIRCTFE